MFLPIIRRRCEDSGRMGGALESCLYRQIPDSLRPSQPTVEEGPLDFKAEGSLFSSATPEYHRPSEPLPSQKAARTSSRSKFCASYPGETAVC
jgi:hypothetical protein